MSTSSRISLPGYVSRLIVHLRMPLYRNGYALVFSSVATSGLGLLYWMLAARSYTAEAIGLNSAALSAMMFLANVSQLSLTTALNRFIPRAGRATRRMVLTTYLVSTTLAAATSLLFVGGIGVWAPALSFLGASPTAVMWFAGATMTWCIFVLQDSILVGLRQAAWIPVENILFAVLKIGLLVALAPALSQYGVFVSWTLAVVFLLFPTNTLIFRYLIPRHMRNTQNRSEPIVFAQVARYVAGDYVSSLIWIATISLIPILVINRAGASANAYVYLPWTITYALYLVGQNMGMSLLAEAAANQAKLREYSYRTLLHTARLLVPAVAIVVLGAPYILSLFGEAYVAQSTTLLRLLALSALPYLVTSVYLSIARAQRRVDRIVLVLASLCLLVLALSVLLLDAYGITGIGWAWLLAQTLVSGVLLLTWLRALWLPYINMGALLGWLAVPRRAWWRLAHRHHVDRAVRLVQEIAPSLAPHGAPPEAWTAFHVIPTLSDMTVVMLGSPGRPSCAAVKLPQSDRAAASLRRQIEVLTALRADLRLAEWCSVVPEVLAQGERAGQLYLVERTLPGVDARRLVSHPEVRKRMLMAAAAAIEPLHRLTGTRIVVGAPVLARWVGEPLQVIRHSYTARLPHDGAMAAIDRLEAELAYALSGRALDASWVHGDYWLGNTLFTADGARLTGIIDWDRAAPDGLPQLDVVHLLLSTRLMAQRCELGDVVRELLDGGGWLPFESSLLNAGSPPSGASLEPRTLALLCWLQHVAANLSKSSGYDRHRLWLARNVDGVLSCV